MAELSPSPSNQYAGSARTFHSAAKPQPAGKTNPARGKIQKPGSHESFPGFPASEFPSARAGILQDSGRILPHAKVAEDAKEDWPIPAIDTVAPFASVA